MDVVPVTLTGNHVVLEPIRPDHAEGLFAIGQTQDDWEYLPIPGFATLTEAEAWVSQALKLADTHITFVLVDPDSGHVMGSTRFMNIQPYHRGLEIGYSWLGRAYQRTVVNTETKYLLLQHVFDVLGAYRVEFKTDERNLRSQQAIERIGATREGVFRQHMVAQHGFVRNSVFFSIIHEEWPQVKSHLEQKLGKG